MFSEKTLEFLAANRAINSKDWFNEHKSDYTEHVLSPLAGLAACLAPDISKIDPMIITEPKVDRVISRIYRDMRYVRDGFMFRDEVWLSFKRDKHAFPAYPEFFFVMSPRSFFYGCGYYSASADAMDCVRTMILDGDKSFTAAIKAYENQSDFVMAGDSYKRNRYPDSPARLADWLNRKNICFQHEAADINELFDESLPEIIADGYTKLKPIYDFFIRAEMMAREKV